MCRRTVPLQSVAHLRAVVDSLHCSLASDQQREVIDLFLSCFSRDVYLPPPGFLIMSDWKKKCQLLFLDKCIMQSERLLWRLIYYGGEISMFQQPGFLHSRSPALIRSDFTSGYKYLSAHLWKAGGPRLLCSFATWKYKWKHLESGAVSVIAVIEWQIKPGGIIMLHRLTQLAASGCLPEHIKQREREKNLPVINGICVFMWEWSLEILYVVCVMPSSFPPTSSFSATSSLVRVPLLQLFTMLL